MPFRDWKDLADPQVHFLESGTVESAHLTIPESSRGWLRDCGWIQEGVPTVKCVKSHRNPFGHTRDTICSSGKTSRARFVGSSKDGLCKPAMEVERRTHAPSSDGQVRKIADPAPKLPAVAERQFVHEVAIKELRGVLRAPPVVPTLVIRILWESPSRDSLRFRGYVVAVLSVESRRVAHTFGPGVIELRLQTSS